MTPITAKLVSEIVANHPGATYSQLQKLLDDGHHNPYGSVDFVFCPGLSHDLWESLHLASVTGTIHAHPADRNLARTKHSAPSARPYYWGPVVWYPGPADACPDCVETVGQL